ncbi:MAG: hypothetical protein COX02_01940 [Candidatus Vogelbacteria bacterium CG22_combo_CG10-13_8_21_14_all_37_9]|uniref:Uncharacterized protein n=1 Tax=Candidatus Vogelbacteria bacterium CG22_combo_CG10-13_8_21_14_all_37_9 TaxID=1975046 RepID=A0A2H0BKI7_9BACT|nr:MAG: hypothetical protein BK005_00890 [bacterium CG10_37_50]PIP58114.1 MAG: hypothetical protein COX02_01940 [Candidatus Vogelbacteria bacterium CG22_combo_CG10-13_8_21_14_all_37_9]
MQNFLKIIIIILTVLIAIISALFVFDFVNLDEVKDLLEKFILLLAILSLGSILISYISKK